jgi:pyruvate/2-oxoacid:ferredoxin oxidoreductase alpha subunit
MRLRLVKTGDSNLRLSYEMTYKDDKRHIVCFGSTKEEVLKDIEAALSEYGIDAKKEINKFKK